MNGARADATYPNPSIITTNLRGKDLLSHSFLNKGSAFEQEERAALGLEGLLPNQVASMKQQIERVYRNITRKTDALERYIGLVGLQDRNEHLFYALLEQHIEEFLPIVYTPTVGDACREYSQIFRRGRGIWITPDHQGHIDEVLSNAPRQDIQLIVVTDNERILGLGDQGAGGMCIPIGKLALYTMAAGIHPQRTLPVSLDVGTDNETLLKDELYLGWRHERLRGERYNALVDEFVEAVQRRFPSALLQWEDFKKGNALEILARYRHELLSFNDDVQGTAAVGLAGVLAGIRAVDMDLAADVRVVIAGAGAAGIGIMRQLRHAMRRAGVDEQSLVSRLAVLDSTGLLTRNRRYPDNEQYKCDFGWPNEVLRAHGLTDNCDLETVVRQFQPNVLIGTTGKSGMFTEAIITAMAATATRPLIFPFSNPTSKAEARPADIVKWTKGRALIATGSPFPPVDYEGRTITIGQGNNVYIFPGVGLGALVACAGEVTGPMFTVAAETLANLVSEEDLATGRLYPPLSRLREVAVVIAEAVAREACRAGVAGLEEQHISTAIESAMWRPVYSRIAPV